MAKSKLTIRTYEDVDKALLELGRHEGFIAKKEAEMNKRIQDIKDRFNEQTADARAAKQMIEQDIKSFCMINKADFMKSRAKKLIHGVIGFRTNPPKVVQLNRKFTVKTSLELLKKIFTGKYVRMKEEIDKEAILADYSKEELTDDKLAAVGLRVDQDEKFFVEIDWDSLNKDAAA